MFDTIIRLVIILFGLQSVRQTLALGPYVIHRIFAAGLALVFAGIIGLTIPEYFVWGVVALMIGLGAMSYAMIRLINAPGPKPPARPRLALVPPVPGDFLYYKTAPFRRFF